MNKNSKKKIFLKVLLIHLIIIFLLDINLSELFNNKSIKLDTVDNSVILNLKSISLEDLEKKRNEIKRKKKILEDLKKKKKAEEEKKKKLKALQKKKAEEEKKKSDLELLKKTEEKELAKYEIEKLERELLGLEKAEALINKQKIRNAQLTDAEQKYILTIKAKIENNWLIPHNTNHDRICTVIVNQLPSGKVTSVKIHECKGDSIYLDSLENAIWKSSPLPIAPDIEVFQENLVLQFEEPN
ncbi:MAG: cell envelope integrity protein TolA [Gammaproteobacteria bacterium]|nr:cell envelope integrity protein TolA [Gammaproteobacteria bacterium]